MDALQQKLSEATEAYQALQMHVATAEVDPFCDEEFTAQLREDLVRAHAAMECAWLAVVAR